MGQIVKPGSCSIPQCGQRDDAIEADGSIAAAERGFHGRSFDGHAAVDNVRKTPGLSWGAEARRPGQGALSRPRPEGRSGERASLPGATPDDSPAWWLSNP